MRCDDRNITIWIDGCFDLVHFGHANAIRQAKSHGRKLIVGVHSDNEILNAKGTEPVFNEAERYKLVRSIKWVDEVIENVPYTTKIETLDKYGCDICMHGDDIVLDENGQDLYAKFKQLGRYKEFKRTEGVSTTDILQRILNAYQKLRAIGYSLQTNSDGLSYSFERSPSLNLISDQSEEESSAEKLVQSPYTSGDTKYYLNTMRISQFSGGPVNLEPRSSDVIVYCPGTFDLFHIGHIEFLEKAAELGDYLIVGLYADQHTELETGRIGSVLRLEERMLSILANRSVNNVIANVPYVITEKFLESYKISVVAVGKMSNSVSNTFDKDPMEVPRSKGMLRIIDSGSNVTTLSVIDRIVRNQLQIGERNALKQRKEMDLIQRMQRMASS